ncbi:MAG: RNA polymerase factor sigma-70 [Planctomycetota bacterium]|nr:MAG: RNA polymerase factor sigma-70 [Planctomycetota bacterium]
MNSKELFEILVREQAHMLSIYIRSTVHDSVLAEDLFQETLMTAWKNIDRFQKDRPFGSWLRGIARNLILNQRRQRKKELVHCTPDVLEFIDGNCDALEQQEGDSLQEKLAGLRVCMNLLPEKFRQAIHLRYMKNVRGVALAESLGTSREYAKKLLQRGRQRLWACLEKKLSLS